MYNYLFYVSLLSLGACFGTLLGFWLGAHYNGKLVTAYQAELKKAEEQVSNLEWMIGNLR
jgi:membrane protein DedA with SNARE-associated domain